MRIQTYTLGGVGTHCYFLINEDTKEALVADPADRADFISEKLEGQGLKLKGILLTHGHGDHIMAVPALREKYGAPLLAHEAEAALLGDPRKNLSTSLRKIRKPYGGQALKGRGNGGACRTVLKDAVYPGPHAGRMLLLRGRRRDSFKRRHPLCWFHRADGFSGGQYAHPGCRHKGQAYALAG